MTPQQPLVYFDNFSAGYNSHPVIQNINGQVNKGALISIMGPNGGGKSTLLKSLAGLLPLLSGSIRYVGETKPKLAYLPQASSLDRSFPITVLETASMGLWHETGPFFAITDNLRDKTLTALKLVNLEGFADKRIGELSGGQLQRVLFARTILEDAELILLDEPFSCVDQQTTQDLMSHILSWHKEGKTVLIVNHNFELTKKYFPETLFLMKTILSWGSTADTLQQMGMQALISPSEILPV